MSVPPKPGNASCTIDADVRSLSMPAESSSPFTTRASDSCSESNTLISFSFGSGSGCAPLVLSSSGMRSPILDSLDPAESPPHRRFYSSRKAERCPGVSQRAWGDEPRPAPSGSCILAEREQNGPIQGAQHWGALRHQIVGGGSTQRGLHGFTSAGCKGIEF